MASVEFITKRIEGKEKEIAKLEQKLARILKAKETGYTVNPYYYNENDLKWTTKDLENAKASLVNYQQQLATETEKANSRNISAIVEFLEQWKARVTSYYNDQFPKYLEARKAWRETASKNCDWHNHGAWQMRKDNPEEYNRIEREYKAAKAKYNARWSFIFDYVDGNTFDDAKLAKHLQRDADAKYDFIIERTNAIVGTITDATDLHIGDKGDLNGYIKGTRGTAKVETIGAGGYNIQCFHFRTLIKEVR